MMFIRYGIIVGILFSIGCGSSSSGDTNTADVQSSNDVDEATNSVPLDANEVLEDSQGMASPPLTNTDDGAPPTLDVDAPTADPGMTPDDDGPIEGPEDLVVPEDTESPNPDAMTSEDSQEPPEPCTSPTEWLCLDDEKLHKCNEETGVVEYQLCGENALCSNGQCKEIICIPDSKQCINPNSYDQCNDEGTDWINSLPCPEGTLCDAETESCVVPPPECPVEECMTANSPVDGECVPEYAELDASCDDSDPSTSSDQCNAEHNCIGTPITCEDLPCHQPGVPNGTDCDFTPKEAGSTCNDASLETAGDACDGAGVCIGAPIVCASMDCHEPGVANGVDCDYAFASNTTSCNDANNATKNDTCNGAGSCIGEPIVCEAIQCMTSSTNGEGCVYANGPAGPSCNDNNTNTANDSCDDSGNCVGEPIVCETGGCISDSIPNGIDCTFEFSPAGTECDDGMGNTINDVCDSFGNCYGMPFDESCTCTQDTGTSMDALLCAMEIGCHPEYVNSSSISSPTGDNINNSYAAVERFGSASNDLAPHGGNSYTLLATGNATGTSHSKSLWGGFAGWDQFSPGGGSVYDAVELSVTLTAPPDAQGFSLEYVFFSVEFDDYVGTSYNDKFYIIMNGPESTGGVDKAINYTDCRNPSEYYDLSGDDCVLESGYCCYIAINTALSECCWYDGCPNGTWTTDISGTGFSCASAQWSDGSSKGSSTGWLTTTWTVEPGETFTLTFHIHDTADGIFDSEVLLDNFKWEFDEVTPGTGISTLF